jgi:hypothetical protein
LVIGWDDEWTFQCEGKADEPRGAELDRLKQRYYEVYPDGPSRLGWKGLIYLRVRIATARFSDFRPGSQRIVELSDLKVTR